MAHILLYSKNYKTKRNSRKKVSLLLTIIFAFSTFVYLLNHFETNTKNNTYVSPLVTANNITSPSATASGQSISRLRVAIETARAGDVGKFGIVVEDIKKGEVYLSGAHEVFPAASLYKLWIMSTAYQQIQLGQIRKDEILSDSISNLNANFNIDPEAAELTEGSITLSVTQALEKMITISDNYSALLLTKRIRLSKVADWLTNQSFNESTVGTDGGMPTTSAYDIALFFEKLYHGELADTQNTDQMLSLLQRQKQNNKLPKYLPQGTLIAHKTGELNTDTHDGGIVYSPKGSYIIVVLAENSGAAVAEEEIAQLSKAVYNYFTE